MTEEKTEKKMIIDRLKPGGDSGTTVDRPEMREVVDIQQLAAELLKGEGVEYLFAVTSGAVGNLETFVQKIGIPRVHFRHEQGATFAADAWGRITRKPGVVLTAGGTAVCFASAGICQAYSAGSPVVYIVAEDAMLHEGRYGGMGISRAENQLKGITKWVQKVATNGAYLYQIKKAFRSALTPPTGPVAISYPRDMGGSAGSSQRVPRMIAQQLYTPGNLPPQILRNPADPTLIEQSLRWLLDAEKPTMIVGHALQQANAQEELREFVHLLGIPCVTRRSARGAVSEYDPLNPGGRARGRVMRASDRCLIMGLRIGSLEKHGASSFWGNDTRYIQAQSCSEMVDFVLDTEYELLGSIKTMLRQYIDCAKDLGIKGPPAKWAQWRQFVADTKTDLEKRTNTRTEKMKGVFPLHPDLAGRLAAEFFHEEYQDDYIAVIDGFTASSYFTDWNKAIYSGQVLDATETIGMGHGPGMSIGAGLATNREKPIFTLLGDGAIGAGGMDIETASRWNIPAVYFHENNNTMIGGVWRPVLSKAIKPTGDIVRDSWETVHNIRYDRMFAEVGCHAEFVERDDQVKPALKRACDFAMREKKPAFIEVFVDPEIIHEIAVGISGAFSRFVKWDEIPEYGQKLILENEFVSKGALPTVDPTWRAAIMAYQKEHQK